MPGGPLLTPPPRLGREIPSGIEASVRTARLRRLIATDIDRYRYLFELDGEGGVVAGRPWVSGLRCLVLCPGLRASVGYRVGHALLSWRPRTRLGRAGRMLLRVGHLAATRWLEITTGISIANGARIGSGLYIGHFGGVIIGVAEMGEHCTISHGVTIGRSGRVGERARPQLGDRVWVGPGAVVVGGIAVGADGVIGANAVVTTDVPARASALGVPARVHARGGSFGLVAYRGDVVDPGRTASLRSLEPSASHRLSRSGPAVPTERRIG